MNAIVYVLFVFLCVTILPAYSTTVIGSTYRLVDSSTLRDILITKTGFLNGTRSIFLGLTVEGRADLDKCLVKGEVISQGLFVAKATEFCDRISIHSGRTILNSCEVKDLYLFDRNANDHENSIYVVLDGATIVFGSIIFETGQGKVYKGPDTLILGKVVGGFLTEDKPTPQP
jgi:hypothetical protein